ncbi:UDP-N-acetylglucosamine 1-carboxyvinyltransferase [candidate division TM6 bacterium RIFCSPHIGHO2_12_FULL_36_22]|nr:MAG: UDP-N-acetylglucosamine 1-carboxyvinyltransferase [candidate division TM6 bacterium RIFCSPHIGHO2_12_FULL_36_22]
MVTDFIRISRSPALKGACEISGAKNAVLVIMASTILAAGKSILRNVPVSSDVLTMIELLEYFGAEIYFDQVDNRIEIDSSTIVQSEVCPNIMSRMRASFLVMGPLLARFGRASMALPGGCSIGQRPIDYHLINFKKMGVIIEEDAYYLKATCQQLQARRLVLEYPSVGATENILMAATLTSGITEIVNAALEPEVQDLINILKKMGANISVQAPATIVIQGVEQLQPVEYAVMPDRLEAGSLLLAAAITGGEISIPNAQPHVMDVFLLKLEQMGHTIITGDDGRGIFLQATSKPQAVSFKTGPYPGFPTDLQAPMMVAQTLADGVSIIEETVFENRLLHIKELQKMGAKIEQHGTKAIVTGVNQLVGASVVASDIRASCALVLAGLVAHGPTHMTGLVHFDRGYDRLREKLTQLGGRVERFSSEILGIEDKLDQQAL